MQRIFIISLLLLLGVFSTEAQQRALTPDVVAAMGKISTDTLLRHARALASDAMEGRGTGSAGERRAAEYVSHVLARIGLQPLGDNSSFLQRIPLHGSIPQPESRFSIFQNERETPLSLGEDYTLYKTGAQTFIPQPIRMVFVGYGIVAPEYDYNDYQNIDVENSIVVFLSGEPASEDEQYFDGLRPTLHSLPEMKQRIALSRGAHGSIMLPLPRIDGAYTWSDWRHMFSFEDVNLPITTPSHLSILMRLERAGQLFRGSSYSLEDVLEMDAEHAVRSFPLDARASFSGVFFERDFLSANIIGMLPGTDPLLRDSYVICSAHYDHLGIGSAVEGDSIYNGFIDNALGCAALLEMARVISSSDVQHRRSILFLFVTGEEKGLLGSRYYCSNPVVPLHRTVANLNVDGLAIIDEFDDVVGVGSEYSTLRNHLERTAEEMELRVSDIPPAFDILEAFSSSDQLSFAQAGIPSILIMEGPAYRSIDRQAGLERFIRWGEERYHSPIDDARQPVHLPAIAQHTRVLLAFLAGIANTYEPPQWITGSRFINARLQTLAEER